MPGMMDTILNLGLNEDVVNTLAQKMKDLLMIVTEDLFKCLAMLLWKYQKLYLKKLLTK